MQVLFPENFIAAVDRLAIEIRPAPPRAAAGAHLSPRTGQSLEFRDYQAYTPGDDLRRVDWNVYGRTRHLFVRRFENPTAVPIFILVDASESMKLETPSRYATAARLAAAIAAAGIASHNPVYLALSDGKSPMLSPLTGRRGFVRALAELSTDRNEGGASIATTLTTILPQIAAKGKGILVLISDFFEAAGVESLISVLRLAPQRLMALRVTQPWDLSPVLDDDNELIDCESGARLRVSVTEAALEQYRAAYGRYFNSLDDYLKRRNAVTALIDASQETVPQLESLFPGGVLSF